MDMASEWSIGFQHPDYGYPMSAWLRVDEGGEAAYVDEMSCDPDYVPEDTYEEITKLCRKWTGRSFDSLADLLRAFKEELGLSQCDVM